MRNRYLERIDERRVFPDPKAIGRLSELDISLPDRGVDPQKVLETLDQIGSPASVASAGSCYFDFVIGGSVPGALAAEWLAGAWDQNAALVATSPIGAKIEDVSLRWLLDVLDLPEDASGAFVTGATMANLTALAAVRHALLLRQGWDVEARGKFEAPPIEVLIGDEVHVSLLKALSMIGFGRDRVPRVAADGQSRMRAEALPEMSENTLGCLQASNVNTGAFDPAHEICRLAHSGWLGFMWTAHLALGRVEEVWSIAY